MHNINSIERTIRFLLTELLLIIPTACATVKSTTPIPNVTSTAPTLQTTTQSFIFPSLLSQWDMKHVYDMAWSPDSRIFVVDSQLNENEQNSIQAFDAKSLTRIWIAGNTPSLDIAFSPNGQSIIESNPVVGILYLRNIERGNLVRQIKSDNCEGG